MEPHLDISDTQDQDLAFVDNILKDLEPEEPPRGCVTHHKYPFAKQVQEQPPTARTRPYKQQRKRTSESEMLRREAEDLMDPPNRENSPPPEKENKRRRTQRVRDDSPVATPKQSTMRSFARDEGSTSPPPKRRALSAFPEPPAPQRQGDKPTVQIPTPSLIVSSSSSTQTSMAEELLQLPEIISPPATVPTNVPGTIPFEQNSLEEKILAKHGWNRHEAARQVFTLDNRPPNTEFFVYFAIQRSGSQPGNMNFEYLFHTSFPDQMNVAFMGAQHALLVLEMMLPDFVDKIINTQCVEKLFEKLVIPGPAIPGGRKLLVNIASTFTMFELEHLHTLLMKIPLFGSTIIMAYGLVDPKTDDMFPFPDLMRAVLYVRGPSVAPCAFAIRSCVACTKLRLYNHPTCL